MLRRKQLNQAFKNKYVDKIVHEADDQYGHIQVIDDGPIRSLHFDAIEKQSSMHLATPEQLVLSYTRYMMLGFLFKPDVGRILCIGLGGGSIPRYLAHYHKECQLDVVEIRQQVIDVAKTYFLLPTEPGINYIRQDGAVFVRNSASEFYDMILVDAYDENGVADAVVQRKFITACGACLKPGGVYCTNLWSYPRHVYRDAMLAIKNLFGSTVMEMQVEDRTNRIILGIKPDWQKPSLQTLKRRSKLLESTLQLPFPKMLETLLKNHPNLLN